MDLKDSQTKRRGVWCDGDVQVLIELWEERASELRRAKRNGHIYKDISLQMDNRFTPEQVHVKIRNFTQKYREERKEMGSSGGRPSTWKFFNDVHRIIGSTATDSADILESFLFENISDASCQPLPESQPLSSPVSQSLPSPVSQSLPSPVWLPSPSSPLDTTSSTSSASSSSGKKRNHLGEVVKMMKEQNVMLKSVVEDSQSLSTEIVNAIREQNQTSKEFLNLMKILIDKL